MPPEESRILDPAMLASAGQLELLARQIVEGAMAGQHQGAFQGGSAEFREHRRYRPGDDLRHLDWRAFGRTGKHVVKEFDEETNLEAWLLLDSSGSMAYQGRAISKFDCARFLAASLGCLLTSQRDAVGMMTFDAEIRTRIEPGVHEIHFRRMLQALASCRPEQASAIGKAFDRITPVLKQRRMVIVISDFFDEPERLQHMLRLLQRSRHEVILMQVLAPEELEFPFQQPLEFQDLERAGAPLPVDPRRMRSIYLQEFQEFQELLKGMARRSGCELLTLTADQPLSPALGAYLDWRTRTTKSTGARFRSM